MVQSTYKELSKKPTAKIRPAGIFQRQSRRPLQIPVDPRGIPRAWRWNTGESFVHGPLGLAASRGPHRIATAESLHSTVICSLPTQKSLIPARGITASAAAKLSSRG